MDGLSSLSPISIEDSILFKKFNKSQEALKSHLEKYFGPTENEPYDAIAVLRFADHLPPLYGIALDTDILGVLQDEAAPMNPYTLRVIQVIEEDWFIEIFGVLGTLVAMAQLIYQIVHDRKIEKTKDVPHESVVRMSGGFVQKQVTYSKEKFFYTQIGKQKEYKIEWLAERYIQTLRVIEIYKKNGEITRITIEQMKPTSDDSSTTTQ